MPNWCVNRVVLESDNVRTDQMIEKVEECSTNSREEGGDLPFMDYFFPMPPGSSNETHVAHWGAKWDINPRFPFMGNPRIFDFESAWAPPLDFFRFMSADPDGIKTTIAFWEPGCDFYGTAVNGVVDDEGSYHDLLKSIHDPSPQLVQSKFVEVFGLKELREMSDMENNYGLT